MSVFLVAVLLWPLVQPAVALACWNEVAQRHRIPVELLHAIAQVESNLNPLVVNRAHQSRTGTYDIGLMQINSAHLKALKRHGVEEAALLDPCVNLEIGAWLLASSFIRRGMTWDAVGAYNAACTQLQGGACSTARTTYAWRVYRQLVKARASGALRGLQVSSDAAASATEPSHSGIPTRSRAASQPRYPRAPATSRVFTRGHGPDSPWPSRPPRPHRPERPHRPDRMQRPHRLHRLRGTDQCPTTVRAARRHGVVASKPKPKPRP